MVTKPTLKTVMKLFQEHKLSKGTKFKDSQWFSAINPNSTTYINVCTSSILAPPFENLPFLVMWQVTFSILSKYLLQIEHLNDFFTSGAARILAINCVHDILERKKSSSSLMTVCIKHYDECLLGNFDYI